MIRSGIVDRLRAGVVALPLSLMVLPALLLTAAYWLNQQVQPLTQKPDSSKRHDPDFIVDKSVTTTLDEGGGPHFVLTAEKILHYPDDDSTSLQVIELLSFEPGQPPMRTYANHGTVLGRGDDIFLHDDVRSVRAASAIQSEMTLTTQYLHVNPGTSVVETDRAVTIVEGRDILHAIGMKFDNKAHVIKLLAQVKGESKNGPIRK